MCGLQLAPAECAQNGVIVLFNSNPPDGRVCALQLSYNPLTHPRGVRIITELSSYRVFHSPSLSVHLTAVCELWSHYLAPAECAQLSYIVVTHRREVSVDNCELFAFFF